MNSINNISFGRGNKNLNSADNKKNHKRNVKIAVAVGITAAAIGGAVLYKNRNSKPVLKFRNFIKDGVISPLKEKNIPFKKKVSTVWNNLKDGVKGFKTKPANYSDTLEIKNSKVQTSSKANNIEKPVKQEIDKNAAIYSPNEKPVVKVADGKAKDAKKSHKSADRKAKQTSADRTFKAANKAQNTDNNTSNPVKRMGDSVLNAAKEHARDLRVAAGTAAVVTGGVVAGEKIGDAVQENKEKNFSIEHNGKAFKGELRDGHAFDENNKPLNGTLIIKYDSGKKVVIDYKDGVLYKSTLFKNAGDIVPETMREYRDGRILNKHDDLIRKPGGSDKEFKSKTVKAFDPYDSMLQFETSYFDEAGKGFRKKYFIKNLGKDNKIKGAPINTFSTEVKENRDGSTIKKIFIPVDGDDKLIRTSNRSKDGTLDINLYGLEGEEIAQLSVDDSNKALVYWHFAQDKDCAAIEINDGKIAADSYEDAAINATLLPDSTENLARYMANDGSVIEIACKNGDIYSIASYANDTDIIPKTKMLFDNGRAFCDIWYNETGEVVFKVNH